MAQSTGVLAWHGVHDDLLSSVQDKRRHDSFHLSGFLAEWNRFKNGSDVHDAIGAYLRKIVTVARASDWCGGPFLTNLV